jgi:hypothetical protein
MELSENKLNSILKSFTKQASLQYYLILILVVLVYYGYSLSFTLFSDDYKILYQVLNGQFINVPFYRPFLKFGMFAIYKMFNGNDIFIHAYIIFWQLITVLTLFFVTQYFNLKADFHLSLFQVFVFTFLFAIYPFHGENVYWLVGSGAISAVFFILLSFYFVIRSNNFSNYFLAAFLYFVSILFYESVLFFPIIIFLCAILFPNIFQLKKMQFFVAFFVIFFIYVWSRNYFTGGITGTYSFLLTNNFIRFFSTIIKFLYRSLFPAFQFNYLLIIPLVLCILFSYLSFYLKPQNTFATKTIFYLFILQIISFFPAAFVSIPVQNIEGDRLLYFSSIFTVILLFYFWIKIFQSSKLILASIILYFAIFHVLHLRLWNASSNNIKNLRTFINNNNLKQIIFLNKNDTYFGVPLFREGLLEFVKLKTNVDTAILTSYTLIEFKGEKAIILQTRNFVLKDSSTIKKVNQEYYKVKGTLMTKITEKMIYFNGNNYQLLK